MNKKLLSIFFLILIISINSHAQIIKAFTAGGMNLAQVDGDKAYGYAKPGVNLGIGAMIPFKNRWDVSLETSFTQKGANQKAFYSQDSLNGAYKLKLNYLELPVLVHFTDKEFITIGTGFAYGRLISATEYEHGKQTETTAFNGVYSTNDYSVLVDLRMRIVKNLKFNFRFQYSIASIRTREFYDRNGAVAETREQYNNLLTFRLLYVFNEEQSARAKNEVNK